MKKTLFPEKKKGEGEVQFSEISNYCHSFRTLIMFFVETPKITPVQTKKQEVQPPKATFVLAPGYWENIIGEKTDVNEIINAIEHSFLYTISIST